MSEKSTTKPSKNVVIITKTDKTAKNANVVKNTETATKAHTKLTAPDGPRWYHYLALVVALALAGAAVWKIFHIYDPSMLGAQHSVRYFYGCTEKDGVGFTDEQIDFRNYGVQVGDMFGPNGHTNNKDEAWIEITELSDDHAIVSRHSGDGDWKSRSVNYGYELSLYKDGEVNECGEALLFTIY